MRLRLGGRGLRSQERLAPAAWAGSWAQCLAEVKLRSGLSTLTDLDLSPLPLATACHDALAAFPAPPPVGREDGALPSWRELALTPGPKAQRLLGGRLDGKHHADLLNTLDTEG